jgi:hypothetical protein
MFKKIKMVKEVKTQKYKPGLGPNNQNTWKILWILVRFLDC